MRASKLKKAAQERNFQLYRLSGMKGNLAQIYYERRNDSPAAKELGIAIDAITAVIQHIKESK